MHTPLVSVVITAFNREKYIAEAIQSALDQDYSNLEIIVSDNASTDNTDKIITSFIHDKRIKYIRHPVNVGMIANFESATAMASGVFITYVSSDDYLINPTFVSRAMELVGKYENILLVCGTFNTFEEMSGVEKLSAGGTFEKEFYEGDELFMQFPRLKAITFAGAFMHKAMLMGIAPFKIDATTLDVLALLKLMLRGNVATINTPSYMLRLHGNNMSTGISIRQAIDNMVYITEPYEEAQKKGFDNEALKNWKIGSAFLYARYITLQFAPQSSADFNAFMEHLRKHFPGVIEKLRINLKWNLMVFLFKRPAFSLPLLRLFRKPVHDYLYTLANLRRPKKNGSNDS